MALNTKPDELHLFILWEHARDKEHEIIADIGRNFHILETIEITWSKKLFSENLTRFYGTNLPPGSQKEQHIGSGPFLLIIVRDNEPTYSVHETSKGPKHINSKTFLSKTSYRDLTGGGHRIHGTNTVKETNHDLTLLLGVNVDDFLASRSNNNENQITQRRRIDLVGASHWKSIEELFYVLNSTAEYIVLRNFEDYPDGVYKEGHEDIDLLCDNLAELVFIVNAEKVFLEEHRVNYRSKLNSNEILFDFRFVGDNYYDRQWEKDLLDTRVKSQGYYRPEPEQYYFSLAYHALLHKPDFSNDYKLRLPGIANAASIKLSSGSAEEHILAVAKFMNRHKYRFVKPVDDSVFQNIKYINLLSNKLR